MCSNLWNISLSMSSFKKIENDFNAIDNINKILNSYQIHILINQDFFSFIVYFILLISIVKHKNEWYNYEGIANNDCNKKVPRLAKATMAIN